LILRLAIALSPIALCMPDGAHAASLAGAVKEADAKYLEAPDLDWVNNAPTIEAGSGEEDTAPKQQISQGAVENGAVTNATNESGFQPAHASWLKEMIGNLPENGDDMNGFLADYVGEKAVLGEGKQAWELMLAHYDKMSEWSLDSCNVPLDEDGDCPGQGVRLSFPEALEHMLKENGYKVED
jgi:hypothetical protein